MRIILIEDNQSLARGITYRLQDLGHAVDVISDGLAGDEFLAGDRGDMVILDINLPRRDGLSLLRAMRARGDGRPVLLLTARADAHDHRPTLHLGSLSLELAGREVSVAGDPLTLPRREVSVLEALLLAEGRTVSKADLLEHVYGTGADVDDSAIEVHVSRLRKRLKPHGLSIVVRRH